MKRLPPLLAGIPTPPLSWFASLKYPRNERLLSLVALSLSVACCGVGAAVAEHAIPAANDAASYPAFDAHAGDHVTIAADPYDTSAKENVFRVDYLKYDILPIRVIVTNSGDRPISLDQARIHLVPAVGDRIQAAEAEDVERKITLKDRVGSTVPIGPIHIHHGGGDSDKKIDQDFAEHEYSALAVEPHTTRAGFLFYNIEGLGKQPLKGAKLLVRRVQDADGKELFYFEVPFDKYLNAPK
jgi:hypothetical protein